MRRIELIKLHLHQLIDSCEVKDMFKLLFELQSVDMMHGYAIATLQTFEDNKIGICTDEEIKIMMRNNEYDNAFDEWLNEKIK